MRSKLLIAKSRLFAKTLTKKHANVMKNSSKLQVCSCILMSNSRLRWTWSRRRSPNWSWGSINSGAAPRKTISTTSIKTCWPTLTSSTLCLFEWNNLTSRGLLLSRLSRKMCQALSFKNVSSELKNTKLITQPILPSKILSTWTEIQVTWGLWWTRPANSDP